jgi:hypothetical protein
MSRAVVLAAALILAPLPAFSQNLQGNQNTPANQTGQQLNRGGETSPYGTGDTAKDEGDRTELRALLDRLSKSELRDRLDAAIERVRDACGSDIEELCGSESPGAGRIASCLRENAEDLSRRCRFTLFRTVRALRQDVRDFADECLDGIKAQCSNTDKVGDCAEQKSAAISPACHAVVIALRTVGQKITHLKDMPVYSSDDKELGRVIEVMRGPDGKVQSVQIQIGRLLGLGDRVVSIGADKLQELQDRIKLQMNSDQVRSLPEAKRQGNY